MKARRPRVGMAAWGVLALSFLVGCGIAQGGRDIERRMQEASCAFTSLRQVLASSEQGGGLYSCRYCTFSPSACAVACATCQGAFGNSSGPVVVSLDGCPAISNVISISSTGVLACTPPTPPTTIEGTLEVYTAHLYDNGTELPQLKYALRYTDAASAEEVVGSFSLGQAAYSADLYTGNKLTVAVKPKAAEGSGRRRAQEGGDGGEGSLACDPLSPFCFDAENLTLLELGGQQQRFVENGVPINITGIALLATVCGQKPPISLQTLRNTLYKSNQARPSSNVNIQHYYSTCSKDRIVFLPSEFLAVEVDLPCSALYQTTNTGQQVYYDSANGCGDPELYGWMRDALAQAQQKLNIPTSGMRNMSYYTTRVLFLADRPACWWPGLASVGCDVSCNTWINQRDPWVDMQTLFQEMGHNIGLHHANRWIDGQNVEYEDFTDPMGSGYPDWGKDPFQNRTMYCLNAPESFKAGWADPSLRLALQPPPPTVPAANRTVVMRPANAMTVIIPSMHFSTENFVYINISNLPDFKPTWPAGAAGVPRSNQLFISYRVRQAAPGYDSALPDDLNRKVYIHNFNSTLRTPPRPDPSNGAMKTSLIAILGNKKQTVAGGKMDMDTFYRFNYGPIPGLPSATNGLHIRFLRTNVTHATVTICYFTTETEICDNGVDDNCNGVPDELEPSCGYKAPPPPRPPSPRPPRPPPPPPYTGRRRDA